MLPDIHQQPSQKSLENALLEQFSRVLVEGMITSPEGLEQRLANCLPARYRASEPTLPELEYEHSILGFLIRVLSRLRFLLTRQSADK